MAEDRYQYVLELSRRETGAVLGRVPVEVDWVPIMEAVEFDLVRQGVLANYGEPPSVQIEPVWRDQSRDAVIRGVRATVASTDGEDRELLVPIDYFRSQAQRIADQFIKTGELKAGDLFEYRVLASNRPKERPRLASRFSFEAVATPLPIRLASPADDFLNHALLFGDVTPTDPHVFIHWRVLEEVSVLTRRAGALETGGVLVGHLHRDPDGPDLFLEVTAQIPAQARSTLTRLSFGPDTWSDVQAQVDARDRGEIWLGWWHSHSFYKQEVPEVAGGEAEREDVRPFLSPEDHLLHRTVFPRAYSLALLVTDAPQSGMSWTVFGWRSGMIAQRSFHVIHAPLPGEFITTREISHATT